MLVLAATGKNLAEVNHLFPLIKQILYWGYSLWYQKGNRLGQRYNIQEITLTIIFY
jgi:hypothetical protein